jgi:glutathione peroxidase
MHQDILNTEITTIDGEHITLEKYQGKVILVVNVASKCGLTPQYEQLENIQKAWEKDGFTVLGFPCNQFRAGAGQRRRDQNLLQHDLWRDFPNGKIDVNGEDRHPLYRKLIAAAPKLSRRKERFL